MSKYIMNKIEETDGPVDGMGPVTFPTQTEPGSGDLFPAIGDISVAIPRKKKKRKFKSFLDFYKDNETVSTHRLETSI